MSFKDSRELGFEECKELISKALTVMLPKESCRDFPCGPVIKTLCFHCRGNGFAPWSGNYDDKCQVSWQNIFKNIINLMFVKKKKKTTPCTIKAGQVKWMKPTQDQYLRHGVSSPMFM